MTESRVDVHVHLHPIKTDDENDAKRHFAVFRTGKPQRIVLVEEADGDAGIRKRVKEVLESNNWILATMTTASPIRREELRETELDETAAGAFLDLLPILQAAGVKALGNLGGNTTPAQHEAMVQLVMAQAPAMLAEAQRRAGLSDEQMRAELLRLSMRMKAKQDK